VVAGALLAARVVALLAFVVFARLIAHLRLVLTDAVPAVVAAAKVRRITRRGLDGGVHKRHRAVVKVGRA